MINSLNFSALSVFSFLLSAADEVDEGIESVIWTTVAFQTAA